jgi:hypothetical protein
VPVAPLDSRDNGVAFLVSAGIVFEIVAAMCSSPQTAELNAQARSETLMKWVKIGEGTAAVFVVIAVYFDRAHAKPIIVGGAMAGAIMYGFYTHALQAGLASNAPPTEQYPTQAAP